MAQEDMKPSDKGNRIRPQGGGEDGQRRGPRFNIYWVWAAIAIVLIGFNVFNGKFTPTAEETSQQDFYSMLLNGDVEKVEIISNKNTVRVYIKQDSLSKEFYKNRACW
jgi:AFG3 family protein